LVGLTLVQVTGPVLLHVKLKVLDVFPSLVTVNDAVRPVEFDGCDTAVPFGVTLTPYVAGGGSHVGGLIVQNWGWTVAVLASWAAAAGGAATCTEGSAKSRQRGRTDNG